MSGPVLVDTSAWTDYLRGRDRLLLHAPDLLAYERLHAFASHWFAKLAIAGTVFLSLWSTAHRLRITCYDLGVRADTLVATIVYAGALAGTAASVLYLMRI